MYLTLQHLKDILNHASQAEPPSAQDQRLQIVIPSSYTQMYQSTFMEVFLVSRKQSIYSSVHPADTKEWYVWTLEIK